jgi:hypothetical protein
MKNDRQWIPSFAAAKYACKPKVGCRFDLQLLGAGLLAESKV